MSRILLAATGVFLTAPLAAQQDVTVIMQTYEQQATAAQVFQRQTAEPTAVFIAASADLEPFVTTPPASNEDMAAVADATKLMINASYQIVEATREYLATSEAAIRKVEGNFIEWIGGVRGEVEAEWARADAARRAQTQAGDELAWLERVALERGCQLTASPPDCPDEVLERLDELEIRSRLAEAEKEISERTARDLAAQEEQMRVFLADVQHHRRVIANARQLTAGTQRTLALELDRNMRLLTNMQRMRDWMVFRDEFDAVQRRLAQYMGAVESFPGIALGELNLPPARGLRDHVQEIEKIRERARVARAEGTNSQGGGR